MQLLGDMPLLGWAVWKARNWIPGAVIYVATEHPEIRQYAISHGCTVLPLTVEDVEDGRDASGPMFDLMTWTPFRPVAFLDCSFPFSRRSEFNAALADGRPFVRPALRRTLHLQEYGNTLSQNLPEQCILQGGLYVARRDRPIACEEWLAPENTYPIGWISAINIDTMEDLETARWLAKFIKIQDLDDTQ